MSAVKAPVLPTAPTRGRPRPLVRTAPNPSPYSAPVAALTSSFSSSKAEGKRPSPVAQRRQQHQAGRPYVVSTRATRQHPAPGAAGDDSVLIPAVAIEGYDDFDDDVMLMDGALPQAVQVERDSPGSVTAASPRTGGHDSKTPRSARGAAALLEHAMNGAAEPVMHVSDAPPLPPSHAAAGELPAADRTVPVRRPTAPYGFDPLPENTKGGDGAPMGAQRLIDRLDALRMTCISEGRLMEAQRCLDEMKSVAQRHAARVARELQSTDATDRAKRVLQERYRSRLLKFTALWEHTMSNFEAKANQAIQSLRERRHREFNGLEDVMRSQIGKQRPHFSSAVVALQKEVGKLVEAAEYAEAHKMKQTMQEMMSCEQSRFEEMQSRRLARQTRLLKRSHAAELRALKMRISSERDQMVAQRQRDHDTLLQRHANEVIAYQQRVKTTTAAALQEIERRMTAMATPGVPRSGFDLKAIDRISENAILELCGPAALSTPL